VGLDQEGGHGDSFHGVEAVGDPVAASDQRDLVTSASGTAAIASIFLPPR
jgi:hypothetical protein